MRKVLSIIVLGCLLFSCQTKEKQFAKDFNFDWKFKLGDPENAQQVEFSDADWRILNLPHDWSVEHEFTKEKTTGATAFLPGGIGWYRKSFTLPQSDSSKVV